MPAIKVRPSKGAMKRDFWGDEKRGQLFEEQINKKFGDYFGSRAIALNTLRLQRRLFNMYITGERNIPNELWATLRKMPNYVAPKRTTKPVIFIDDVDPLS